MLPLWARVDLGAMAMKGYSTFPKAPALLEPHHQIVLCHIQNTRWGGGSYPSVEVQSVYSTAAADWAIQKNYSRQFNSIRIKEEKNKIKFTSDNTEIHNQPFTLTELQNSISKSNNIFKISSRYIQQYLDLW